MLDKRRNEDTIDDLLEETIYNVNKEFINTFAQTNIAKNIHPKTEEDYVFIKSEYLQTYLNFVKENKRILKVIHHKPHLFKVNSVYEKMCDKIFYPAMRSFNVSPEKEPYIFEYFTKGTVAIINK